MNMSIDSRESLDIETVGQLNAAENAIGENDDGTPERNALRRYRRLIRSVSGLPYVTCHAVEHSAADCPATMMVEFGT